MAQLRPESLKQGPNKPAQGEFPGKSPQAHPEKEDEPQVPAADPEAKHQPAPEESCQKQTVPEPAQALPQGPEKSVQCPQDPAHEEGPEDLPEGQGRGVHPSRRLSQPPGLLGSS